MISEYRLNKHEAQPGRGTATGPAVEVVEEAAAVVEAEEEVVAAAAVAVRHISHLARGTGMSGKFPLHRSGLN